MAHSDDVGGDLAGARSRPLHVPGDLACGNRHGYPVDLADGVTDPANRLDSLASRGLNQRDRRAIYLNRFFPMPICAFYRATQGRSRSSACTPMHFRGEAMFAGVKGPSFIYWPVGCGDSSSVVISDTEVLQIDLNDTAIAEADDNEKIPLVDELVAKLPKKDGKPYLSCFLLTHPDEDHCRGFADLLKRVTIGELWHTPRVFREFNDGVSHCDDAKAFRKEAKRRVGATIAAKGDPGAGNRVRVVGYDDLLQEDDYKGFPRAFFTTPGQSVTMLDGADIGTRFAAFVHAPFRNDPGDSRNETSLAMQVVIGTSKCSMSGLFLGDLSYPTLRKIVDETKNHRNLPKLNWNVLLSPHHCSKKAMYEKDEDGNDVFKKDILDDLDARQLSPGFIVASSVAIPGNNSSGDNPPHAKAKNRYSEIVNDDFICTGEYSTPEKMRPVIYTVTDEGGIVQVDKDYALAESTKEDLAKAIAAARGSSKPPAGKVGFGRG